MFRDWPASNSMLARDRYLALDKVTEKEIYTDSTVNRRRGSADQSD